MSDIVLNTGPQKQVKTGYSTSLRLKVKVIIITATKHKRHRHKLMLQQCHLTTDASVHLAINNKGKSNSDAEMERWQRRKARSVRQENSEKRPQALKRKEMHIKVQSEENSGVQNYQKKYNLHCL